MFGNLFGSFDTDVFDEFRRLEGELDQLFGRGPCPPAYVRCGAARSPHSTWVRRPTGSMSTSSPPVSIRRASIFQCSRTCSSVSGTRKVPVNEAADYYRRERFDGDFRRVITLPDDVDPDRVDAKYRDGVLQITVQRRESARLRQITVS